MFIMFELLYQPIHFIDLYKLNLFYFGTPISYLASPGGGTLLNKHHANVARYFSVGSGVNKSFKWIPEFISVPGVNKSIKLVPDKYRASDCSQD